MSQPAAPDAFRAARDRVRQWLETHFDADGCFRPAPGRVEAARCMAEGFVRLLTAQPEPGRFYNRYRRDGSVVSPSSC